MVATAASSETFTPTYESVGCHNQEEHAMVQAFSGRTLVEDTRVQFYFRRFEVCSSKAGNGTQVSMPVTLLFPVGIIPRTFHTYLYFSSILACIV